MSKELEIAQEFNRLAINFDQQMARIDPEMFWQAEWKDKRSLDLLFHPQQPVEELPLFRWAHMTADSFVIEDAAEGRRST